MNFYPGQWRDFGWIGRTDARVVALWATRQSHYSGVEGLTDVTAHNGEAERTLRIKARLVKP